MTHALFCHLNLCASLSAIGSQGQNSKDEGVCDVIALGVPPPSRWGTRHSSSRALQSHNALSGAMQAPQGHRDITQLGETQNPDQDEEPQGGWVLSMKV